MMMDRGGRRAAPGSAMRSAATARSDRMMMLYALAHGGFCDLTEIGEGLFHALGALRYVVGDVEGARLELVVRHVTDAADLRNT
jgi:hypothetical protein